MAIAFRSGAATSTAGFPSSIDATVPAGVLSGDVMVAYILADQAQQGSTTVLGAAPTGWTTLEQDTDPGGGGVAQIVFGAYYRVAGASEPATYTFTQSNGCEMGAVLLAYSGDNTGTPVAGHSGAAANLTAGNTVTIPAITFSGAGCELVCGFGATGASGTIATPSGMTARTALALTSVTQIATFDLALSSTSPSPTEATAGSNGGGAAGVGVVLNPVVATLPPGLGPSLHMEPTQTYPIGW